MQISYSREAYQDRARAMLELWGAEIAQLRYKAFRHPQGGLRVNAMKRLEELEGLYNEAFEQYGAMAENGGGRIDDIRKTFEQVTDRLRQNLDELIQEVA